MADLMDMQDPSGMPSFLDMASATKPQMMGNSPSPFAGTMYGQDARRHDQMIQQAAMLAQIKAKLQGQHADEMSAATSGRMDEIMVKNALAGQNKQDIPTLTQTRKAKNLNDLDGERLKAA